METLQLAHNSHLSPNLKFSESDPHLRKMQAQEIKYRPPLLSELPTKAPGIYLLTGGRQVGKTTALKLWMKELLSNDWPPQNLIFLTGEIIDNHHQLIQAINEIFENQFDKNASSILILDEVTYIKDWDKGIKFLADLGIFNKTVLILTGSDLKILKDAPSTFPGRRGQALKDFRLWPLSFRETLVAKGLATTDAQAKLNDEKLGLAFSEYLQHGGYLVAINDWAKGGKIEQQTYKTYTDWIFGDFLKRNKSAQHLREVLSALINRYSTPLSWNNLVKDLSIDHPATVADYVELLVSLEALIVLPALEEDTLRAAPKKAKKIFFLDPFIYQAVSFLLNPATSAAELLTNPEIAGLIVEGVAAAHFYRKYPTFYIKAQSEVDIAYIDKSKFYPVEIKWTNQIRPAELKQVLKYKNGVILGKNYGETRLGDIVVNYLPRKLLELC